LRSAAGREKRHPSSEVVSGGTADARRAVGSRCPRIDDAVRLFLRHPR